MAPSDSLDPAYFEHVYGANDDPWNFATSEYERDKYRETLAALPQARYRNAFEVGCSIGVLTRGLAERCDRLLAVDVSERPLQQARQRCADQPHVTFARMQVPQEFPPETFDLVMLSEVAYYWSTPDLESACRQVMAALNPGGNLLLVHWTEPVHDCPQTGDQVHELFLRQGDRLIHRLGQRHEKYRLDLFEKAG